MINLLPSDTKRSLRAARLNVVLRRYIIYIAICLVSATVIFGVGYVLTSRERASAEQQLSDFESNNASYARIKQESEAFSKNLSIASTILSSEITFSEMIVTVAKILPSGTILTSLNVTTESAGEPMAINARVADPEGALRLKAALEESALFEDVSVATINSPVDDDTSDPISQKYPYTVVLNTRLSKSDTATGAAQP